MAKVSLGAIAEGLFDDFMAPLVLGGPMTPRRPIGGRAALAIGRARSVTDIDRTAHVQLARIRVARKTAPLDRLEPATEAEWALAACLHDLVQATHPALVGLFRGKAPQKLLDNVTATLERVAPVRTAHEALSRHTWFSRLFGIARTDTRVSWWVGSRTFLGTAPSERLTSWPELRRVHIERVPHPLTDLPTRGGAVDPDLFAATLRRFLSRVPLTDLATATRATPRFEWTPETLSFVGSRAGRTLALRALATSDAGEVAAAFGQATRALIASEERGLDAAATFLGELVLAEVSSSRKDADSKPVPSKAGDDAPLTRAIGAIVALRELAKNPSVFGPERRGQLVSRLEPLAQSAAGAPFRSWLRASEGADAPAAE